MSDYGLVKIKRFINQDAKPVCMDRNVRDRTTCPMLTIEHKGAVRESTYCWCGYLGEDLQLDDDGVSVYAAEACPVWEVTCKDMQGGTVGYNASNMYDSARYIRRALDVARKALDDIEDQADGVGNDASAIMDACNAAAAEPVHG